jgi:hypothetical protein
VLAAVQRYDTPRHPLVQEHHIPGRLQDVQRCRHVHRSRHAGDEAVGGRVVIATLRQLAVLLLRNRPGLHRQDAVGRIDDDTAA